MINVGDMRAVQALIGRLGVEIKSLIKSSFELSYYSRGAWPYDLVLTMSAGEREMAAEFINERLKAAGKMQHPVF